MVAWMAGPFRLDFNPNSRAWGCVGMLPVVAARGPNGCTNGSAQNGAFMTTDLVAYGGANASSNCRVKR